MKAYIFDTETTGVNQPEIVEAAYMQLSPNTRIASDEFIERYKPSKAIEWGAIATHHIFPEDVIDCPPSSTFKLPEDCTHIVGHAVDYDWGALPASERSRDIKRICTLAISNHLWPDADSHKLTALVYMLYGPRLRKLCHGAHSALTDCHITVNLLSAILEKTNISTWDDLYALSEKCRIPLKIGFGKHKGTRLEDIPMDYINWYLRQTEQDDPYLAKGLSMVRSGTYHPPSIV